MKKVFVGMSGGVDSSVAAALLTQRGYEVTGVYMKNWSQDLPGMKCPWREDFEDAKRVAVQLEIPFKMYDFEKEYRQKVVNYMVNEYRAGRTPNPDVMCNQEVKFKVFFETALEDGADFIATGHYARVNNGQLLTGVDVNKDQSYFLYRVSEKALKKTLFPIGEYKKPEIRKLAKKIGLVTAEKKDSQGICFVGKVGIKDFLVNELGEQPAGNIVNQAGEIIGRHDGAIFYTIGQRHGLDVGGGLPYYVTGKDVNKNEVYVTTDLNDQKLWQKKLTLTDLHWINAPPAINEMYQIRTRYRAPLTNCRLENIKVNSLTAVLTEETKAAAPGQSAVVYDGDQVLGGGIISA